MAIILASVPGRPGIARSGSNYRAHRDSDNITVPSSNPLCHSADVHANFLATAWSKN